MLILISVLVILFGLWQLVFSTIAGMVDTGSVTILLSGDGIDQEILSNFKYTSWRAPSRYIRPFVFRNKSFEGCEIVRYRRGFWPHWLVWRTYYEAEYLLPDGSKVIGPAFGPIPYSAPNLLVSIPTILVGIILLITGIKKKSKHRLKSDGIKVDT
jgi:hypothetical protein